MCRPAPEPYCISNLLRSKHLGLFAEFIGTPSRTNDRFGPRSRLSVECESTVTSGSCSTSRNNYIGLSVVQVRMAGPGCLTDQWLPQCPSHKSRLFNRSSLCFDLEATLLKSVDPHPTPAAQYGKSIGGMQPQYLSSPGPTRTRPPGIETAESTRV